MAKKQIRKPHQATFDDIRHVDKAGNEFWRARQLAKVLEYSEYWHFVPVVERAKTACQTSGQSVADHFEDILGMVGIGSGAQREVDDVRLSRYACYLIVQNGDSAKPVIANGQTLKMGEKNSDGGQFFTPREVIRAMVHTVKPSLGQTIYDPCCGTGGFLAIAYEHIARKLGNAAAATDIDTLKHDTFFGREKENLVFPIALANLVLHGIDQPNLWHGNSLTRRATYAELFRNAPPQFDVILANSPFGGKEGKDAQKNFAFETSATQVLFVQDILGELAPRGTCAIVLDEGLLFRTNESAFVETKRKLTDECDLWAIVSLPGGVFSTAGAGVKTNLLLFTKGRKTERIWYYDLSWVKVGKKTPLTLAHFGFAPDGGVLDDSALPAMLVVDWQSDEANAGKPFPSYAHQLASRGSPESDSRYSWTLDFAARRAKAREEMQPLLDQAAQLRAEAVDLKERLKHLKKGRATDRVLQAHETQIREKEKATRDLEAQAAAIDAAVFDLKAVNPNVVATVDVRTPAEIISSIEAQGTIVELALGRLRAMLATTE